MVRQGGGAEGGVKGRVAGYIHNFVRQQGGAHGLAAVPGDADVEPSRWRVADQGAQIRGGRGRRHFADTGDDKVGLLAYADAVGMAAHAAQAIGRQQRARLGGQGDD